MCFIYSAFELSCALRGLVHRYLLRETDHESWVLIDSDVVVCADLSPLFEEIERAPISLCAHATTPVFPELRGHPELEFLRGGVYNAGVVGIRRGATAERFVDWFCARLRRHASEEMPTFVDQLWLNLVPSVFPETRVIRHPGVNVGHWNLHERPLRFDESGGIRVGEAPLLIAHLSGADPSRPDRVSTWAEWLDGRAPPAWAELVRRYAEGLSRHGGELAARVEYGFSRFLDGSPILPEHRRKHRGELLAGIRREGDPFAHPEWFAPPPAPPPPPPPALWRRALRRWAGSR